MFGLSNRPTPVYNSLSAQQLNELKSVYKALGGLLDEVPVRFGAWDIVTPDFIIELDEEQHFNRYRMQTLDASLYHDYRWFDVSKYKAYCTVMEDNCLKKAKRGGYWKNDSTTKQFGVASNNGDLTGNGSPRWKQRAFYDYCRDLVGKVYNLPVYRFSIYDEINNKGNMIELGVALSQGRKDAVISFLNAKINN